MPESKPEEKPVATPADKPADKVSASTQAAMPGGSSPGGKAAKSADADAPEHTVYINDVKYTWKEGDEGSVPAEAVAVYEASVAANTP